MNSYFASPFLSSLPGDNQGPGNGVPTNYTGISTRYDQSSGYLNNQPVHGHYGAGASAAGPTGHTEPPSCARPSELNGYSNQSGLPGGWGMPPGQHNMGEYPPQAPPNSSPEVFNSCSVSNNSYNGTNSGTTLPFYPWMGIVGRYTKY